MLHFGNKATREIYQFGATKGVPDEVARKAVRQLDIMAAATNLREVRFAGHGRLLKQLRSSPTRFHIHVLGKWWISFFWHMTDASEVRLEKRKGEK
jgi:plasmid maintenance system killer protein